KQGSIKMNGLPITYEKRSIESELKAEQTDGKRKLFGFIPYNKRSVDMYGIYEEIAPGAFKKSISERNVVALVNHDATKVLGSLGAGTLRFDDRDDGLYIEVDLPDTTYARDAYEVIARGDIKTMSFGFQPIITETRSEAGVDIVTLKEVKLFEVSFMVAFPAYEDTTSVAVTRSTISTIKKERGIDFGEAITVLAKPELTAYDKAKLAAVVRAIASILNQGEQDPQAQAQEQAEPAETTQPSEEQRAIEDLETLVVLETLI
ncbi:MAG TPA: HK97 family phage prohead protease, partial [Bacillota bacterium]|nr:HK97 family phage prohead protease [Bacillota bacterium]